MRWKELRNQIIDLGFEEDYIYDAGEYKRLIINACNRAISIITSTVTPQLEGYLTGIWGYEDTESDENGKEKTTWIFPTPRTIDEETEDTAKINLPDILLPLVPLLAAHYVWLDDDVTKATMYWNEYDQLKEQILTAFKLPKNSVIIGGF